MADRMTAEEARKKKEKETADADKCREVRDILRLCATAYEAIASRKQLDIIIGESLGVDDKGVCKLTFTVDMQKLESPNKREMGERKMLFYTSISVFKDAFEDLAPRRGITPFTFLVLGLDGAVVKRVEVK